MSDALSAALHATAERRSPPLAPARRLPITAPRPGDDPPRVGVGLALVAMHGSGAASRGVRWYSAEGPPTLLWQESAQPPPAPGDLYLDRLSGSIYELEA